MTGHVDRTPPFSEDAEQAVLSAMLIDPSIVTRIRPMIATSDFYAARHGKLFGAMLDLADAGSVIDPLTIASLLSDRGELTVCGGKDYIGFVYDMVPTAAHAEHHAAIVREKAMARRMIATLTDATRELYKGAIPTRDLAVDLQSKLLPATATRAGDGFVHVRDDLWALMDRMETAMQNPDVAQTNVVPTGFPELDDVLPGGIPRGELLIIAGVPGGCKTSLAMNIALNAAVPFGERQAFGVGVVSAEMTRSALHQRNLAAIGRVNFQSIIRPTALRDDDFPRLTNAVGTLGHAPLWVDETPRPVIDDVMAKCHALKAEHPEIALIVVDFIQLLQKMLRDRRMRDDNRALVLTDVAYDLKGLAKSADVAVIATCQVDAAGIAKREDHRPDPGDARWSQGMYEAADLWGSVFRPKMYDPDPMAPDTLEFIFQKGRNIPVPFTVPLHWIGQHMLVTSLRQKRGGI